MRVIRTSFRPPALRSIHVSGAEHSAVVVYGATRLDGSIMPARDFLSDAIAQTNFTIQGDLKQGFISVNEELHTNIKQSIQDEKWKWDRVTYRRNGDMVDSPRDIVDTSDLLNSQSWSLR